MCPFGKSLSSRLALIYKECSDTAVRRLRTRRRHPPCEEQGSGRYPRPPTMIGCGQRRSGVSQAVIHPRHPCLGMHRRATALPSDDLCNNAESSDKDRGLTLLSQAKREARFPLKGEPPKWKRYHPSEEEPPPPGKRSTRFRGVLTPTQPSTQRTSSAVRWVRQ